MYKLNLIKQGENMLKKTLMSLVVCLGLSSSVSATELQNDMGILAGTLSEVQIGFFTNDKKSTLESLDRLQSEVKKYLGDKDTVTKLLPEEVQYKASIAVNSAEMIDKSIVQIKEVLKDKNMRMINRQMKTQKAFLEIQNQCFRCHNLVRDWQ